LLSIANDSPERGILLVAENVPIAFQDLVIETGLDDTELSAILTELSRLDMLSIDANYAINNWHTHAAPKLFPDDWEERRIEIFKRDGGSCVYCGHMAEHIDHIHPRSKNGGHKNNNLAAACASCNMSKGNKYWRKWFREQPFFDARREAYIDQVLSDNSR